jgi:hypothetical protein
MTLLYWRWGKTPLKDAEENHYEEIVKIFEDAQTDNSWESKQMSTLRRSYLYEEGQGQCYFFIVDVCTQSYLLSSPEDAS